MSNNFKTGSILREPIIFILKLLQHATKLWRTLEEYRSRLEALQCVSYIGTIVTTIEAPITDYFRDYVRDLEKYKVVHILSYVGG